MEEEHFPIDNLPLLSQAGWLRDIIGYHLHSHPGCEMIYVSEGSCRIVVSGHTYTLAKGDLIILAANAEHDQTNLGVTETFFVTFTFPEQQFNQTTRVLHFQEEPFVPRMFRLLFDMNAAKIYNTSNGLLFSLLCRIAMLERIGENLYDLPVPLQKALERIDADFARPDLLGTLAPQCGVSEGYLRYLFRKWLRTSPQVRLRDRRMAEARRLLHNHQYEIAEIAPKCGYPNANYFSRIFHSVTRCTPSQFREIEWKKLDADIRK